MRENERLREERREGGKLEGVFIKVSVRENERIEEERKVGKRCFLEGMRE